MNEEEWDFENQRDPDFTSSQAINLIKPYYDSVTENKLLFLHHGTFNVYEVDNYIFRIPDKTLYNRKGWNLIRREVNNLNFVRNNLTITVPKPEFISTDPSKPLVGYVKIPGQSLDKLWKFITGEKIISIAKELGLFLAQFHSSTMQKHYVSRFNVVPLTQDDIARDFKEIFDRVKNIIYPMITNSLQKHLEALFTDYLDNFDKCRFTPCVTHQDFDTSNILIDPESYKISGIIDFEDMNLGDPAYDLVFIAQGRSFSDTLLSNYANKDEFLLKRISFYYQRTGIPYLLYGIDHNLPDMIKYGKYMLNKRMSLPF